MSVLTGPEILRVVNRTRAFREGGHPPPLPFIEIDPFSPEQVGPNSYDVRLSDKLLVYQLEEPKKAEQFMAMFPGSDVRWCLDARADNPTAEYNISDGGFVLYPGVLYLGSTVERTATAGLVPWLDGKSSLGRLGVSVHVTAGRGDDGFGVENPGGCSWTLEIQVVHPIRIYKDMKIAQLTFFTLTGDRMPYRGRYGKQQGPTASKLWEDEK